jgi:hypothetical protein
MDMYMDMQNGCEHAAWAQTCNIDMDVDMQHRLAAWTWYAA